MIGGGNKKYRENKIKGKMKGNKYEHREAKITRKEEREINKSQ